MKGEEVNVPDLAASFQDRIAGILAEKLLLAAADTGAKQVCLAGALPPTDAAPAGERRCPEAECKSLSAGAEILR